MPNRTASLRSSLPNLNCTLDPGIKEEAPGQVLLSLSHSPVLFFLLIEKAAFPHRGDISITIVGQYYPMWSTLSGHSRDNSEEQILDPVALTEWFLTVATEDNKEFRDSITSS